MPTFTIKLTPSGVPIAEAVVSRPVPNGSEVQEVKILALLDTGVDMTFLDHSVLESLGLEPEPGKASVYTFSTGLKPHTALPCGHPNC